MNNLGDWAIAYATGLNWFVFPLKPRDKTPITRNGFKDASNDPAQVKAWWTHEPNANIAVDCGRSNLAVVDIDGTTALTRWNEIVVGLELPYARCAVAATGGGGNHIVYAQPTPRIRNTTGKIGTGIDTRGDGGYIVLAPSIHPSGGVYEWLNEQEPYYGLDPMPALLIDIVLHTPVPMPETKTLPNPKGAVKAAVNKVVRAQKGARNTVLSNQTWFLFHLVKDGQVPRNVAIEALTYAARAIGLSDREIEHTITSKARLFLGG